MNLSAYDIAVDRINEWVKNGNKYMYLKLDDICLTDDDFDRLNIPSTVSYMNCSYNRLTKLNLNISNLNFLYCRENDLREINTNAPQLIELFCENNNNLSKIQLSTNKLRYLICSDNKYLYLPKKYRKLYGGSYNVNYNYNAVIIQQKYRKYKAKILCNYLNDICFMYSDINQIICLY